MPSRRSKHALPREAEQIAAIILAAGPRKTLPFPKPLTPFGKTLAIDRAVQNCLNAKGYGPTVVVLGSDAEQVLTSWKRPRGVQVLINTRWRQGQLSSLRAALRRTPRNAAFLIYPVDYPLISPGLLARLRWAYVHRSPHQQIVAPSIGRRDGHPILVAPSLRAEFARARTARDVVHHPDRQSRNLHVPVHDSAIFRDFDSPSTYRLCVRMLRARHRA